jgi:hypothetical protein
VYFQSTSISDVRPLNSNIGLPGSIQWRKLVFMDLVDVTILSSFTMHYRYAVTSRIAHAVVASSEDSAKFTDT